MAIISKRLLPQLKEEALALGLIMSGMLSVYHPVCCRYEEGCYKHCPAKTYPVEDAMTCVACEEGCVSCDDQECHWCETDLFLAGTLSPQAIGTETQFVSFCYILSN